MAACAGSLKEWQRAEGQMHRADATHQWALVALDQATFNLDRTILTAPAAGKITNFALRADHYASAGNAVGVLIESEAVYVARYFEKTKLPRSISATE
jgi:multidrug resistance efflux pump